MISAMSRDGVRHSGGCRCGRVSFKYDPAALRFVLHCHCADCRRTTCAAFSTWVGLSATGLRSQGPPPSRWQSSLGVRWGFCPACGMRLTYDAEEDRDEVHILIGAFAEPGALVPMRHVHWPERLPWLALSDDLPRHIAGSRSPLVDAADAAE